MTNHKTVHLPLIQGVALCNFSTNSSATHSTSPTTQKKLNDIHTLEKVGDCVYGIVFHSANKCVAHVSQNPVVPGNVCYSTSVAFQTSTRVAFQTSTRVAFQTSTRVAFQTSTRVAFQTSTQYAICKKSIARTSISMSAAMIVHLATTIRN